MEENTGNEFDITGLNFSSDNSAYNLSAIQPEATPAVEETPAEEVAPVIEEAPAGPSVDDLLAKIKELESAQAQPRGVAPEVAAILQDKQAMLELAKDYESMPIIDLLKEDFEEKHKQVFASNPTLDRDLAFRKYLQRAYNQDIEPLIEDTLGLDEYDYAVLQAQVADIRNSKLGKQAEVKAILNGNVVQNETAQAPVGDASPSLEEYEHRLIDHIESSLKNSKSIALDIDGFNMPSVGNDKLKEMVNTLGIDQLPLLVAEDNNVYPNMGLLKELADYRELTKTLPEMFKSFREKVIAETVGSIKNGAFNKSDMPQSPSQPFQGEVVSPRNIGEYAISGIKI